MPPNPLCQSNGDPDDPGPLVELKTRLVLYTPRPPGPITARRIYDLYMARFGAGVSGYRSTSLGDVAEDWTPMTQSRFEAVELPDLRRYENWGYIFGSGRPIDARVFMLHGARPTTEAGRASVFLCDFEWNFDPAVLRQFTAEVLEGVEGVCGTAGYVLVPDEGDYAAPAYDLMFAWAMRYWGAEAQDLDALVDFTLTGFPCISWLTILGPEMVSTNLVAVESGKAKAHSWFEAGGHVVIQAEEKPRLIDRNRQESIGNYGPVAEALLPFQASSPTSFACSMWDEDNTKRYLRRFTHPDEV